MSPDDVVVEGGDPALGDHSPPGPNPPHYAKDVGIRADRADGFVLDNVKVRHFNEHDVYVTETDGFHLDRLKTDYAGEYGVLTFVADHSLIENCAAWGNGDSGIYPGAAADLGDAVPRRSAPLRQRDPGLRQLPQRARLLGDRRQRRLGPQQRVLRQHPGLLDRRLHRARPPRLPAGLRPDREQQLLLEQLQRLPAAMHSGPDARPDGPEPGLHGLQPERPGSGRDRPVDRGRQPQHRPQQPLLGQLATRHDALQRCPTSWSAARASAASIRAS